LCGKSTYGVYDVTRNEAWVSVGTDHETARFAVNTIGQWWRRMGKKHYLRLSNTYQHKMADVR